MGHKALGITGVYFKPTPNDLLEGNDKMLGYANVMKFLTISDENRLRLEVEKLSLKNKGNEQVINATLQEKDEQIKSLSEQFKTIQSKMQEMISTFNSLDQRGKNELAGKLVKHRLYIA